MSLVDSRPQPAEVVAEPAATPTAAAESEVVQPTRARRPSRWPTVITLLGVSALVAPFAIMIGVSLTRTWWPWGDLALIELRTHDVGGPMTPLVGSYSRFGWYHPGPLSFWLLALPYRLLGARPAGMLVGAALLHAVTVAGCLVLAHRRGGRALLATTAVVLALVIRGFDMNNLVTFWNPFLPLFVLAFLILATWSVIEGDQWALPAVIVSSCFAWQTHIGYLPVAALLTVVALTAFALPWVRAWRGPLDSLGLHDPDDVRRDARTRKRVGVASAATAAVCLAPLVIDQVTTDPGNMRLLLGGTEGTTTASLGVRNALAVAAAHLAPTGVWIGGGGAPQKILGLTGVLWLVVSAVVVGSVLALTRRAGSPPAARFLGLTTACAAMAVFAVFQTAGEPLPYLFMWVIPVAAMLWMSVIWALVEVIRRQVPGTGDIAWAGLGAIVLALATVALSFNMVTSTHRTLPGEDAAAPLAVLGPAATAATAGQARVRLRASRGWCAREITVGLAAQLAENGTDVAVDDRYPIEFGRERVRDDTLPVIELFCGPDAGERVRRSADTPIAAFDLLTDAESAEIRVLGDGFREQLRADGRPDLLAAVDSQALGTVAEMAKDGYPFDPAKAARYGWLMQRSRFSGAIYWQPEPAPFVRGADR